MRRVGIIVLLAASLINVYMLFAIILFKLSPVKLDSLINQLQLVINHPQLLEERLQRANFIPFGTIGVSLRKGEHIAPVQWMNLYGNIMIFIPTGILMAFTVNKHHISNAAFTAFLLSLLLESLQLSLLMGSFDVDDLILNTLGGVIGALLAYAVIRIRTNIKLRIAEQ